MLMDDFILMNFLVVEFGNYEFLLVVTEILGIAYLIG